MPPAEALPPFVGDPGLDGGFAVRLPRASTAAGAARHVVKQHFNDLLADETLDDALLVVSELVTNALLHGAGDIELRVAFDGAAPEGRGDRPGHPLHATAARTRVGPDRRPRPPPGRMRRRQLGARRRIHPRLV